MAFPTRGLSWVSPSAATLIRDFRNTSERLGFRGAVDPAMWADIEHDHIRASAALCRYVADFEQRERERRTKLKTKRNR